MAKYIIDVDKTEKIITQHEMVLKKVLLDAEISRSKWYRIMVLNKPTSFGNVAALAFALNVNKAKPLNGRDERDEPLVPHDIIKRKIK